MTSGLLSTGKSDTGKMTTGIGPRPLSVMSTVKIYNNILVSLIIQLAVGKRIAKIDNMY